MTCLELKEMDEPLSSIKTFFLDAKLYFRGKNDSQIKKKKDKAQIRFRD